MWTCATSTVSCHGDDGAGMDVGAFGDETLGEVAIADGEVAVTEGDIEAERLSLPILVTSPCIIAYVGSYFAFKSSPLCWAFLFVNGSLR